LSPLPDSRPSEPAAPDVCELAPPVDAIVVAPPLVVGLVVPVVAPVPPVSVPPVVSAIPHSSSTDWEHAFGLAMDVHVYSG